MITAYAIVAAILALVLIMGAQIVGISEQAQASNIKRSNNYTKLAVLLCIIDAIYQTVSGLLS